MVLAAYDADRELGDLNMHNYYYSNNYNNEIYMQIGRCEHDAM